MATGACDVTAGLMAMISVKAGGLWLQSGIYSDEAKRIAGAAGMNFVQGRCMMVEHG